MKDTDRDTQKKYRELMLKKSGEERLKMGFDMFRFASKFIISSLREKGVEDSDLRKEVFLRVYGNDFSEEEKRNIIARLDRYQKEHPDTTDLM